MQFATALGGMTNNEPQVPDRPTGEIELVGACHPTAADFVLTPPGQGDDPPPDDGSRAIASAGEAALPGSTVDAEWWQPLG